MLVLINELLKLNLFQLDLIQNFFLLYFTRFGIKNYLTAFLFNYLANIICSLFFFLKIICLLLAYNNFLLLLNFQLLSYFYLNLRYSLQKLMIRTFQ